MSESLAAARAGELVMLAAYLVRGELELLTEELDDPEPLRRGARLLAEHNSVKLRTQATELLLALNDVAGLWLRRRDGGYSVDRRILDLVLDALERVDDETVLAGYLADSERMGAMLHARAYPKLVRARPKLATRVALEVLGRPELPKMVREAVLRNLPPRAIHPAKLRELVARNGAELTVVYAQHLASSPSDWSALERLVRSGGIPPRAWVPRAALQTRGPARLEALARELDDDALLSEVLDALRTEASTAAVLRAATCTVDAGRARALDLLTRRDHPRTRELARAALADPSRRVQQAALEALSRVGTGDDLPAMRALVDPSDRYEERYNPYAVGEYAAAAVERLEARLRGEHVVQKS